MRRRKRAREGQEKRKGENKRLILKKLCAALLRSFRGQHSEKMKGSARGNWDPREGQQPFRPNPNGAGDLTTTLRRLLIGAVTDLSQKQLVNSSIQFITMQVDRTIYNYLYQYMGVKFFAPKCTSKQKPTTR